jgi:hypothetical protein
MSEIIAQGLAERLAKHRGEGVGARIAETGGHRGDILPSRQPPQGVGEPGLMPQSTKRIPVSFANNHANVRLLAPAISDHSSSVSGLPGSRKKVLHMRFAGVARGIGMCRG